MDLFNRRARHLDAGEALAAMPDSWSLETVRPGLQSAVAQSAHGVSAFKFKQFKAMFGKCTFIVF